MWCCYVRGQLYNYNLLKTRISQCGYQLDIQLDTFNLWICFASRFLKPQSLKVTVVVIQADQNGNEVPSICSCNIVDLLVFLICTATSWDYSHYQCPCLNVLPYQWFSCDETKSKLYTIKQHKATMSLCCQDVPEVTMSDQPLSHTLLFIAVDLVSTDGFPLISSSPRQALLFLIVTLFTIPGTRWFQQGAYRYGCPTHPHRVPMCQ